MAKTPLIKKLRIQSGQRVLILNAPSGYFDLLGDLPEDVTVSESAGGDAYEFVQFFAKDSEDLKSLRPVALAAVAYDGLLWLCYPKKSSGVDSDLSREVVWEMMNGTGFRPVTQIAIDKTWSALRFRPEERVGR